MNKEKLKLEILISVQLLITIELELKQELHFMQVPKFGEKKSYLFNFILIKF